MNEFGNYLYALRRKKGMTQQELADELGVTNKAVSNWETGETFPETKQLVPLADIFGVSVDDLLRGRESEAAPPDPEPAPKQDEQKPLPKKEEIIEKYLPYRWKKKFAVLISIGVALILAGVIAVLSFSLATENERLHILGACILLGCVTLGVDFCMVAGMWQENAFLPVSDEKWHKKLKQFILFISLGVSLILLGVTVIVACSAFDGMEGFSDAWYIPSFVLIAFGVVSTVYGGITWDAYSKKVIADLKGEDAENVRRVLDHRDGHDTLGGKICGALMLLATILYLLLGFVWQLWHPGWIVFPVAALLCAIVGIFFGKK
ncbi:MAG: helix-turn-helix domain-containing protein [Clostridiales bacterium]|nr:helix-turn-helix domain-containing protein [Clostridiales bacterium]